MEMASIFITLIGLQIFGVLFDKIITKPYKELKVELVRSLNMSLRQFSAVLHVTLQDRSVDQTTLN